MGSYRVSSRCGKEGVVSPVGNPSLQLCPLRCLIETSLPGVYFPIGKFNCLMSGLPFLEFPTDRRNVSTSNGPIFPIAPPIVFESNF